MSLSPRVLRPVVLALLAAPAVAQSVLPEDPGPLAVGWQDVSFTHPLSGNPTVEARLYYPAVAAGENTAPDPTAGPFPQVGMLHGFFAFADYYDDLCTHVASWGFVVASVATESGFFMSIPDMAADGHALLTWVEEQSQAGGPFDGLVSIGADWSVMGHSNGGAVAFHLAAAEPRVRRLVLMEPNWLSPPGVASFDGAVLVIGASEDLVTPAQANAAVYFEQLGNTERRFYTVVVGSGHNGSLDFPFEATSLSHAEAQAVHRRLAGGFLRAEVAGDEDVYSLLVGEEAELAPIAPTSRADDPVLWALAQPGGLRLGLAGRDDDALAIVAVSTGPGALPTAFGTVGLDLAGALIAAAAMPPDGSLDVVVPYDASVVGLSVLAQGLRVAPAGDGRVSRVASLVL